MASHVNGKWGCSMTHKVMYIEFLMRWCVVELETNEVVSDMYDNSEEAEKKCQQLKNANADAQR